MLASAKSLVPVDSQDRRMSTTARAATRDQRQDASFVKDGRNVVFSSGRRDQRGIGNAGTGPPVAASSPNTAPSRGGPEQP